MNKFYLLLFEAIVLTAVNPSLFKRGTCGIIKKSSTGFQKDASLHAKGIVLIKVWVFFVYTPWIYITLKLQAGGVLYESRVC